MILLLHLTSNLSAIRQMGYGLVLVAGTNGGYFIHGQNARFETEDRTSR